MTDFLGGRSIELDSSTPFVLVGPHSIDQYRRDIPLVKSTHGATELLGYIRLHELGRNERPGENEIHILSESLQMPFPHFSEYEIEQPDRKARFIFAWRGRASRRDEESLKRLFAQNLPEIVRALYVDKPPADYSVEWAISGLVSAADASSRTQVSIFDRSNRSAFLQIYLLVIMVAMLTLISALIIVRN